MAREPTSFAATALRLFDQGWQPVPVHGKAAILPRWNELCTKRWDRAGLTATLPDYVGYACGIAVDDEHAALDIDIIEHRLAHEVAVLANRTFGRTPLIRIGRQPKTVRLYRCQPCADIRSRRLHPVDLLAGSGQIVAFGWHPDTQLPYRWPKASPLTVAADSVEIPLIDAAQIAHFIAATETLLARTHYRCADARTARPARYTGRADVHHRLRIKALQLGFERAAATLLAGVVEGERHMTLYAVVASAAGRGWSADRVTELVDACFAGWAGVSRSAFATMLTSCFTDKEQDDG
jgi:hypothetical protein